MLPTARQLTMIGDADPEQDVCSIPPSTKSPWRAATSATCSTPATSRGARSRVGSTCRPSTPTAAPAARGSRCRPSRTSRSHRPTTSRTTPFQYYASTANPTHARPSSIAAIGQTTMPNTTARACEPPLRLGRLLRRARPATLPAVSFVKAPAFQDGHAGYSNPIDEQAFVVNVVNAVQESKFWESTAIVILYDDSDGWYDHQMPPIVNPSSSAAPR